VLLGEKSFRQGGKSVALGLLLHFTVAFSAATVFCLAARQLPLLIALPFVYGVLYGIAVFLVMNLIVVPLSARPKRPVNTAGVVAQILIHIFFVGLPISLSASHFLKP
jgi:uncharacterized membrane protein YagU involved in acid resistance